MEMEEFIRSAPLWAQISVALLFAIFLIGVGPFCGWWVLHKNRTEGPTAVREYYTRPVVQISAWWREPVPSVSSEDRPQRFGALDVTFAGAPKADKKKDKDATDEIPIVPAAPVPPPPMPEPETEPVPQSFACTFCGSTDLHGPHDVTEQPAWAVDGTTEWDFIDAYEEELKEAEEAAIRAFLADPLGAWYVPPAVQDHTTYLPEADNTFRLLVQRNKLTGEGATVSAEWEDWKLEEVYA
jgi:hypothetical protein